ncbi:hypothetical protein MTR67_052755 [Solanum verrucosum]|uniref:Retrotransposon gag domain-containing protein n=1 Tax=Solanum verrucosum TaxID=315347 RepID=A0AAF0V7G8_SOLVR|nr:hypothetical protein MTR67_052755 [Solanum verrucosum]
MLDARGVWFITLQLRGCAKEWWRTLIKSRIVGSIPIEWDVFSSAFQNCVIPWSMREKIRLRFQSLTEGSLSMTEYEAYFCELSRHAMTIVLDEAERVRRGTPTPQNGDRGSTQTTGSRKGQCSAFPRRPEVETSDVLIIGIVSVYHSHTSVLFDPESTFLYVSTNFSIGFDMMFDCVPVPIHVSTPMGQFLVVDQLDNVTVKIKYPLSHIDDLFDQLHVFIDYISVYFKTEKDHDQYLRIVLHKLMEEKLYAKFSNFSTIASPLTILTRQSMSFQCYECKESFQNLKTLLTLASILTLPEEGLDFINYCDASRVRLGYVLMHKGKSEGSELESLQYVFSQRDLNLRQRRWHKLPKDYDITILYHLGKANLVADALSRKASSMEVLPIRERQFDDEKLYLIRDKVMKGEAKEVVLASEYVLRIGGRICVPKIFFRGVSLAKRSSVNISGLEALQHDLSTRLDMSTTFHPHR